MSRPSQPSGPSQQEENIPVTFLPSPSPVKKGQSVKILIADEHPVFRYGLRTLFHREADMEVVGEAADGAEAVKFASELKPDILLIDLAIQCASEAKRCKRSLAPFRTCALSSC